MPHFWNYLNQANRQIRDLKSLSEEPDAQTYLARIMRMLRRELSLRFEKRSLVYVDDDSQLLFDRWENREIWATSVPTERYPTYTVEGVGEVSPRDVSIVRQSQAFSLSIPAVAKESSIGTLSLLRRLINASLLDGLTSPDQVLERIQNDEIMRFIGQSVDKGILAIELPTGFSFIYAPEKRFGGCLQINKKHAGWTVSIADEFSGVSNHTNDESSTMFAAVIEPHDEHERSYQVATDKSNALSRLKQWIGESLERIEYERMSSMGKYDVALSYAGDDREIVEEVAARLMLRGYRVFYDKYEQAALWGKDLYQNLASVYSEQAAFCVIFISESYRDKLWTKHELRQAQARALRESREYILPVRLDNTQLPGLPATVGYVEIEEVGINGLVNLLSEKLEEMT